MNYMEAFEKIVAQQTARVNKMKEDSDFIDYQALPKIIIGVIGSAIGGVMSLLGGYVINVYMFESTKYLFTIPNAISIVEGVTFGIVVCLACGIYPAWQAANLNPIDALRHE